MQLDLNLLKAFDALLEEGSVRGAAERLYLSPPAMSRTLGRIRRVTGDQILVRTGRTMTPTPYALAVHEQVHALVQQAEAVLTPQRELDLSTLKRTFTLQCHDIVTTTVGTEFLERVRTHAPGVVIRLLPEAATDTNELRHGQVDLEIGSAEPQLPEVRFETIGHDPLVVAMRADHPLAREELTIERFAAADHVIVSRRGRTRDPIDDQLERRRLRRRVVGTAPTSTSGLYYALRSDVLVVAPKSFGRPIVQALGLRTRPLPVDLPPVPIMLAWHQRYDTDRAHAWLRDGVRSALTAILEPVSG